MHPKVVKVKMYNRRKVEVVSVSILNASCTHY